MEGLLLFSEDIKKMTSEQAESAAEYLEAAADRLNARFRWMDVRPDVPAKPESYVDEDSPFFVLGALENAEECRRMYYLLEALSTWFREYSSGEASFGALSWFLDEYEVLIS